MDDVFFCHSQKVDLKIIVKIPIYHSLESGKGKLRSTGRTKLSKQKFMFQITMEIMYIFIRKNLLLVIKLFLDIQRMAQCSNKLSLRYQSYNE